MNRSQNSSGKSKRFNKTRSKSRDVHFEDAKQDTRKDNKSKMCANDPSWYIREGQLAKDVASLSFNTAIGVPASVNPSFGSGTAGLVGSKFTAPGLMAIHTIAAPGFSTSPTSAINIASKNIYSWVRHENSGHTNYDSPDLMLYFLAMDSVYNLIQHLQRVIGVSTSFSQKNRYIGDALITAMGIEPSNFRSNLAQYRARLNMSIVKASVFAVPATFTLFNRHSWMYSSLFMDSPVDKAQLYFYLPSIVHKFIEKTSEGPGYLEAVPTFVRNSVNNYILANTITFGDAMNILDELIGALQASEDINIMSGDVLKAYGRDKLFNLALVPENYAIAPIYSEEILDQIHNTRFAGIYPRKASIAGTDPITLSLESLRVTQDPTIGAGNIIFQPAFAVSQHLGFDAILDMTDNEPTPERVLVATRNTIGGMVMKSGDVWLTFLTSFASDIPLFASLYRVADTGSLEATSIYTGGLFGNNSWVVPYIRMFHKAPIIYNGTVDVTAGTYTINVPNGDIENYTIVDSSTLNKLHDSSILSMLGVPV